VADGRSRSERRLGLALNSYDRASFRLQTKVGRFLVPGQADDLDSTGQPIVNDVGGYPHGGHTTPGARIGVTHDYSYDALFRQADDSLQRLGTSYLDSLVVSAAGHPPVLSVAQFRRAIFPHTH
jgi:aryl-alcohol dehydrogenase-like predicted oxidoreductase